ncbi:MAG TPA: alpha/beta hydrolase [Blastocatellia bacterium]|nr:alpha/beta hydrolase [Blastocatellia bacterium]HMY76691.1 alpha/beta hydrolase [Blastocatellia bacterium]HMZ17070.1 alpha/beta hydrolase [Blastocatellia bacterium]HNG32999.1 alpha/beta hydrolase [Blastocatellia bacterium]
MEPISHFFYSHRLKLQFWDWGTEGKPTMILVHGGLDHARNWDWVARALRDDFHVYAIDLRGHGNSQHAPGALYTLAEHVLDLSALADVINDYPIYIIGHSLGGIVSLIYTGTFPEKVKKLVAIEGLGPPPNHHIHAPASKRMRRWVEGIRKTEKREPHSYPNLDAAVSRMKEANPHLSDDVARHLTLHGTNWNSDGSLTWKFDNFARPFPPFGQNLDDMRELFGQITCPTLLFWGMESWAQDPEKDNRAAVIKNHKLIKVPNAGHWVHHDQLELFLTETKKFLAD